MRALGLSIVPALVAALVAVPGAAPSADAQTVPWSPGGPVHGMAVETNVAITLSDGLTLRADHAYPTDLATGAPATGQFPTIVTLTPYGKAVLGAPEEFFVSRGYHWLSVDIRGTGASEGQFELFDPQVGRDGAEVVRWAATNLPNNNGRVGMTGESYLGINQLYTAAFVGRNSPLKAIMPIVPAHDPYREHTSAPAGNEIWAISLAGGTTSPALYAPEDPLYSASLAIAHPLSVAAFAAGMQTSGNVTGSGPYADDGPWWRAHSPGEYLSKIVENGVPAFMIAGWKDYFKSRGHLLNYTGLQNAWAGRPVHLPMAPGQRVTGRYQLLLGPDSHTGDQSGMDRRYIALKWFDHWLKVPNDIADTKKPLHLWVVGQGGYVDYDNASFPSGTYAPYYFGPGRTGTAAESANDGQLRTIPPSDIAGTSDVMTQTVDACTYQDLDGGYVLPLRGACGTSLAYTTPPITEDRMLVGPINVHALLSSTSGNAFVGVRVYDVAPDGSTTTLQWGHQLASRQPLDETRTWRVNGRITKPWHRNTSDAKQPLTPGVVTEVDVEVWPAFAMIRAGHAIRVVLTPTPGGTHLSGPHALEYTGFTGGLLQIQRSATAASYVHMALSPVAPFQDACELCAGRAPAE